MRFEYCLCWMLSLLSLAFFAQADTRMFVIQGLAGEDYYQRHFDEQVEQLLEVSEKLQSDQPLELFRVEQAQKADILAALDKAIADLDPEDQLVIYLIGHGSYNGRDYKFNIPGTDLSGADLLASLTSESISGQEEQNIILISTSSSSGALLELFDESAVHLVTATKSGAERTATRFGRHFVEGLSSGEADLNKNQTISLQEAFDFAVRETESFFDSQGLLATEHARLQVAQNRALSPDLIRLANLIEQKETSDPVLIELYSQRDELDGQIDGLRLRRTSMTEEDYLAQFQSLMIELSVLQFEIDGLESPEDAPEGTAE